MNKLTIEVTKEDIVKGKQGEPSQCAIARAVKRQGFKEVDVAGIRDNIYLSKGNKDFIGKIPASITKWINRFDSLPAENVAKLKPFSFSVSLKDITVV